MDAELASKRAALDPADAAAKEALGAEEERRNQAAEAFNARIPVLREQATAVNTERRERERAAKAAAKK